MGYKKSFNVALGLILMVTGVGASCVFASDPSPEGGAESVAVRLHLTDESIPADDPNAAVWDTIQPSEFKLAPQVHWPDRIQEVTVKSVKVRGMHNGQDMAILLEYADPSEDAADAAAIEFMVGDKMAHFAHGQEMLQVEGGAVNIWYWKKEHGKATDMNAKGFKTIRAQENQNVSATGAWQAGTWRVVFSRPLQTGDEHDVQITPGEWRNLAFAFLGWGNRGWGGQGTRFTKSRFIVVVRSGRAATGQFHVWIRRVGYCACCRLSVFPGEKNSEG